VVRKLDARSAAVFALARRGAVKSFGMVIDDAIAGLAISVEYIMLHSSTIDCETTPS
jgi:hypothetical protein